MHQPITRDRIIQDFTFRLPTSGAQALAHHKVNARTRDLALELEALVPHGRELSLALTRLQEVRMWANAGLAIAGAGEGT